MSTDDPPEKRFSELHDRLSILQDATNQLGGLIDRLAHFDFQPGSVPLGATAEDSVGAELSSEINQILREQEEELELLLEEITDMHPRKHSAQQGHDKDRLKAGADRLGDELQRCRTYFRKAQVSAKRNLEAAQRQERQLLYASLANPRSGAASPAPKPEDAQEAGPPPQQQQQLRLKQKRKAGGAASSSSTKEDQMVSASNDVTQSLRQTYDMMASELSRSEFANRTLEESTRALADLSESYSGLDSMLSTSRDLLGTLFKSQKTDTWYLETSLFVLAATVAWLVFRRWLYGPMWWTVWLPLKLLFRLAGGTASAVSRGGGGGGGAQPGHHPDPAAHSGPQQAQMNSEGAPTAQVGQGQAGRSDKGADPGSLAEQVGRIADGPQGGEEEKGGETVLREREEGDGPPNPKKRVLDHAEPDPSLQGAPEEEMRVRDEL